MRALEVIRDRIFIADELEEMEIYDRWTEANKGLITGTSGYRKFEHTVEGIHKDLVAAAKKPF